MANPANRKTGSATVAIFRPENTVDDYTLVGDDQTTFKFDSSVDTVDVTAGSETERYFKPTIEGLTWSLSLYDAGQSFKDKIQPRQEGRLTVYPDGVGSGLEYFQMNVLIESYNETFPFDGVREIEIAGMRQGAMLVPIGSLQA